MPGSNASDGSHDADASEASGTWEPSDSEDASGVESRRTLTFRVGDTELVIRRRYEVAGIVNDALIAVWFIVGSVLFLSAGSTTSGDICFLLGSVELLIRPVIRLARHVHLQRVRTLLLPTESSQDF